MGLTCIARSRVCSWAELSLLLGRPHSRGPHRQGGPSIRHRRIGASMTAESDDVVRSLEKLAELHASGVLSSEEFASAKSRLLGAPSSQDARHDPTPLTQDASGVGDSEIPGGKEDPNTTSPDNQTSPSSLSDHSPPSGESTAEQQHDSTPSPPDQPPPVRAQPYPSLGSGHRHPPGTADASSSSAAESSQPPAEESQAPGKADDASATVVSTGPTTTQIKRFIIFVLLGSAALGGVLALVDATTRGGVETEASSSGVTVSTVGPDDDDDFVCAFAGALYAVNESGGPVTVMAEFGLYEDDRLIETQHGAWELRTDYRGWLQGSDWPGDIWIGHENLTCGISDLEVHDRG